MGAQQSTQRGTDTLTFTHRWTIRNFAHLYDEACQWKWNVESQVFTVPGNKELQFSLVFCPKVKKGTNDKEYLEMALVANQIPEMWVGKITVKEVRYIVNEQGRKLFTKEYPYMKVDKANILINADAFTVAELLDPSKGYLINGTLKVLTQVTLFSQKHLFNFFNWPFTDEDTYSTTIIPSSMSRFSHRFTIAHFKWLANKRKEEMPLKVVSQYSAPQREDIGKMKLEFYPKGMKGSDEEKVWIAIQNENKNSLLVHFEYSLVNRKGDKCHQKEYTNLIPSNSCKMRSLSRRTLLSLLSSLPKDELIIDWNVTILTPEKGVNTSTPSCSFIDLALFNYHYVPFTWTIEAYLKQASTQEYADSPLFSSPKDSGYAFFFRLYPKKNKKDVIIELNLAPNCPINECKVNWQHAVVNAKGKEWNAYVWSCVITKGKGIGPKKLISHKELNKNYSIPLLDDKLIIKSQVWIHEPRKNVPPELSNLPSNNPFAKLFRGIPHIFIGDNAQLTNSIVAAGSTLNTGNIAQNSSSHPASL